MQTAVSSAESWFITAMKVQRESLGMSQRKLCDALAERDVVIDSSGITRIETGERSIRLGEAIAIASVLGIDMRSGDAEAAALTIAAKRIRKMSVDLASFADSLSVH